MEKLISTNPANNYSILGDVSISSSEEINKKVKTANNAKLYWKEIGVLKRIELLRPICEEFKKRTSPWGPHPSPPGQRQSTGNRLMSLPSL